MVVESVSSAMKWGDVSILTILLAVIGYLWRQNATLRSKRELEMVARIESSIDNLTQTIKESTEKFEKTSDNMWSHIGALDKRLSNLIGQHEVNHRVKME